MLFKKNYNISAQCPEYLKRNKHIQAEIFVEHIVLGHAVQLTGSDP